MYAVQKGLNPGIYETWEECKKNVIGFSGSVYRKCKTMEEAREFCAPRGILKKRKSLESGVVDVYTDGSFIKKNGYEGCGYGIYIPKYKKKMGKILKGDKTNNRAELSAIIDAIEYLVNKGDKNICIYTDSSYSILIFGDTGKKYKKKQYKNVKNADLVKKANDLQELEVLLTFEHVRAHSGKTENEIERGNDMADEIANNYAVKDYIKQDRKWQEYFTIGHKNVKEYSKEYLKEYIKRKSYLELCKKNENKRTERHKIIYFLME